MALNHTTCAQAVVAAIHAVKPLTVGETVIAEQMWGTIINAIFTHIKANMQVNSTVAVTSVSGVTTGGGVSGPGAGTTTSGVIT